MRSVVFVAFVVIAAIVVVRARETDTRGSRVIRFAIHSSLVHQTLQETAVIPPGGASSRRPLLVFLHGKGEDQDSNLSGQLFAALASLGARAPDVVFPDGGEDSYWHDRRDGAWGSYVMREVIPQAIRRLHADPRRIAIGGLSMGGFGAYDLAARYPGKFCAVGGDSAALWVSPGESAPGAFDSAEDFSRHDVIGMARSARSPYKGASLWLDVGTKDPFLLADTTLVEALRSRGRSVEFHVWPGGHDQAYWRSHWTSYLTFYANALTTCHPD
jgi:enterochelin esterase-like enzyme